MRKDTDALMRQIVKEEQEANAKQLKRIQSALSKHGKNMRGVELMTLENAISPIIGRIVMGR